MILAWGDARQRVEARVRSVTGVLGRPRILTRNRRADSNLTVLPVGGGVVAWLDRLEGRDVQRVARFTAAGRFTKPRTLARARELLDPPGLLSAPPGLLVVRGFGAPGGPPLRTTHVPLR
jgi:hypothetical protein